MRIVLDTNIVLSALLWQGTPHHLLAAIRQQPGVQLYSSTALLGLDLGQVGGIGVYGVQRLGRRFGPVRDQRAQNVLRDFEADAVGEGGCHAKTIQPSSSGQSDVEAASINESKPPLV